jgi:hypothetical protein
MDLSIDLLKSYRWGDSLLFACSVTADAVNFATSSASSTDISTSAFFAAALSGLGFAPGSM